jgi:hypothetical protein
MRHDTAGDPMSDIKWTRRTTRNIAEQLATLGIQVSKNTVGRLLKGLGFRLRVNRKQIATSKSPDRNQQFLYIGAQRELFAAQGLPIISVDAKKKELIGNFKNAGAKANRGSVFLGTSHDTPAFAVDAIAQWWLQEGSQRYPAAQDLFILADGGGSNGSRPRAWKKALQDTICNSLGLRVTVCHYPPGTSKWNPIEHRLFSQISRNWAGEPLTDIDKTLNFIRTTSTSTGLAVTAHLIADSYVKGIRVTDSEMRMLSLQRHDTLGRWNYTLQPRQIVN